MKAEQKRRAARQPRTGRLRQTAAFRRLPLPRRQRYGRVLLATGCAIGHHPGHPARRDRPSRPRIRTRKVPAPGS